MNKHKTEHENLLAKHPINTERYSPCVDLVGDICGVNRFHRDDLGFKPTVIHRLADDIGQLLAFDDSRGESLEDADGDFGHTCEFGNRACDGV